MKVVIDISEETYSKIQRGEALYPADANDVIFAVETGAPIEKCEDAISRQAVLEKIHEAPYINDCSNIGMLLEAWINSIPAEKVGHWIDAEVLNKIREEIEEYRDAMPWESKSVVKWEAINYILEHIIDKYKASPTGEEEQAE